jgi:hypothetical protein
MNKRIILLLLFAASFSSCKKDKIPAPLLSKTEMLCGTTFKKWKVVKYQKARGLTVTETTPDVLNTISSTYSDNLMVFYTNGTEKLNEGPTGANPGTDYSTVAWVFNADETVLNCTFLFGFLGNADAQLNGKIVEISNDKMVLDNEFAFSGGSYFTRWTLVPAN